MIRKGFHAFLAYVKEAKEDSPKLEDIHIVQEYLDVFLDELPGLPLERKVEFGIEVLSGTEPISILPYRVTLIELKELKEQLQDLLNRDFI